MTAGQQQDAFGVNQKNQNVMQYAYVTEPPVEAQSVEPLVLGLIALGIGACFLVAPLFAFALTSANAISMPVFFVVWGCAHVTALILGGRGWYKTRRRGPTSYYVVCIVANVLNWLGLAAFGLVLVISRAF